MGNFEIKFLSTNSAKSCLSSQILVGNSRSWFDISLSVFNSVRLPMDLGKNSSAFPFKFRSKRFFALPMFSGIL